MARDPTPTWFFVLVVVRLGHRFLLVRERKHGQLWYLPAGRVEPGEDLAEAALRETLEEAGIPVVLEGILRFERSVIFDGDVRMRVIYVARPAGDTPPKTQADDESLEARWVSLLEMDTLPLRGAEVREILEHAASGGQVFPLSLLTAEGAPFPAG